MDRPWWDNPFEEAYFPGPKTTPDDPKLGVINLLKSDPNITKVDIGLALEIDVKQVIQILQELVAEGKIRPRQVHQEEQKTTLKSPAETLVEQTPQKTRFYQKHARPKRKYRSLEPGQCDSQIPDRKD